jgi:hypothetical protein
MWTVRGTVHLFISTGRSPDKITFVSLTTNHNTNYQGLYGLFLFKSVPSFVLGMSSCRSSFNCSLGIYLHVVSACISSCRRCFCLEDLRRRRRPPNNVGVIFGTDHLGSQFLVDLNTLVSSEVVKKYVCAVLSAKHWNEPPGGALCGGTDGPRHRTGWFTTWA